jgi:hypothetical protein
MTSQAQATPSNWSAELDSLVQQLQHETIGLTVAGLFVVGIIALTRKDPFRDPNWDGLLCLLCIALGLITLAVGRWKYSAAAVTLVAGCLAIDLLTVAWSGMPSAVFLLAISAGLATLTMTRTAGGAGSARLSRPGGLVHGGHDPARPQPLAPSHRDDVDGV